MLLGLNNWCFSFAWGMRDFIPSKPMTIDDLIEKVQAYKLNGIQAWGLDRGLNSMPALGTPEFEAFQKRLCHLGLFWEVSAEFVADEADMVRCLDYAVALGQPFVRAYFGKLSTSYIVESLDDYVSDNIIHLENIMPKFEENGVFLCLENHAALRLKHFQRVFRAIKSDYLGVCLDTGNAVLTFEDPLEIVRELAPRTYTAHLKDWKLIRTDDGIIARGCPLGDGVVDLPAVVEILRRYCPDPEGLHLNIETGQEYRTLNIFTSEFWKCHKEISGGELGNILRLVEKRNADPRGDYRLASMRGASEVEILTEEESAVYESVRYARKVLHL